MGEGRRTMKTLRDVVRGRCRGAVDIATEHRITHFRSKRLSNNWVDGSGRRFQFLDLRLLDLIKQRAGQPGRPSREAVA